MEASALRSHLAKVEILSEASSDFVAQLARQMAPCLLLPGQSLVQDSGAAGHTMMISDIRKLDRIG